MIYKQNISAQIQSFEELLKDYEGNLRDNPDSIFYKGLVKNTREYLESMYEEARNRNLVGLSIQSLSNVLQNPLVQ